MLVDDEHELVVPLRVGGFGDARPELLVSVYRNDVVDVDIPGGDSLWRVEIEGRDQVDLEAMEVCVEALVEVE